MKKNKAREKLKADPYLIKLVEQVLFLNGDYVSRQKLKAITGEADLDIRTAKKALSYDRAVITSNKGKGYRFAKHSDVLTWEQKQQELKEIIRMICFYQSYISSMKMSMRPLIAHKKMMEKSIKEELEKCTTT